MHVFLFLISCIADEKILANPISSDVDLFASIPSTSDNLFTSDNNIFGDESSPDGDASITDSLFAGDDLQLSSGGSDLLLGSSNGDDSTVLASSATCNGLQSSSDLDGGLDMLTARDLADEFPGLQELTAPLDQLRKGGQCASPDSTTNSGNSKPGTTKPTRPIRIPRERYQPYQNPTQYILTGFLPSECLPDYPIPLYCEGPWVWDTDVLGCTKYATTLVLEIPRLGAYCCQDYETGEVDSLRPSLQYYANHAFGRGVGIDCVRVSWSEPPQYYPQPRTYPNPSWLNN